MSGRAPPGGRAVCGLEETVIIRHIWCPKCTSVSRRFTV